MVSDNEILVAVLSSRSYTEAAKTLGLSKQTVSRRMKDSELKSRVIALRKSVLDSVNMRLIDGSKQAVDVLINLLASENEMTRYNAASRILGLSQDFIESADIINELEQLKTEMERRKGDG